MDSVPQNPFDSTPQRQCTGECKQWFPATSQFFYSHSSSKGKLRPDCKVCVKATMQRKRDASRPPQVVIPEGYKQCYTCKEIKLATKEFFYLNGYSKDGWEYHCKECSSTYNKSRYAPKRKSRPTPQEGYKICFVCERELPATHAHFHRSSITKDGLRYECSECRSKQAKIDRLDHEVKAKEHTLNKRWYAEHRAEKAAYQEENKERIKGYQHWYSRVNAERKKKYRQDNHEYFTERGRQYRINHFQQLQARERAYRQTPRGIAVRKAKEHRRRARKMATPGTLTHEQILRKLRLQRFRCYYCFTKLEKRKGRYVYHLEHTIPLSRTEHNPRHDASYVVLSCRHCNLTKSDKLLHEWPQGGRLF